ncbi:hypothetical protein EW145_g7226 [Phellinidium pouzarii]|uniref:DUF4110 domain-containing protein n=1 Tax=Phellinidium pouzarii TaxID=167371 RepID=A0A4V3XAV4_9AGAM|nr:hypothetical protein EW145_g7226 [Phellinidium pouzarii]
MGPREYTLDDFYALPLDKLDRFVCLKSCDVALPKDGDLIESSDDDDDDDGGGGDDDDDDDDGDFGIDDVDEQENNEEDADDEVVKTKTKRKAEKNKDLEEEESVAEPEVCLVHVLVFHLLDSDFGFSTKQLDLRAQAQALLGVANDTQSAKAGAARSAEDALSTPLPGETLAMFYARSREYWAGKAHEASDNRGKSLRRDGFALAQDRYAAYKPLLEEVEKILAEAGLDEEEIKSGAAGGMGGAKGENRNRR